MWAYQEYPEVIHVYNNVKNLQLEVPMLVSSSQS